MPSLAKILTGSIYILYSGHRRFAMFFLFVARRDKSAIFDYLPQQKAANRQMM